MGKRAICALFAAATVLAAAGTAAAGDVNIHGAFSQGYLKSSDYNYLTPDTKDGTFSFNEAIVNMSTSVGNKTRIGVQFLGRDLGRDGNGTFILDWAFGDYRWKDELGFRVGKVKTPLGFYNKTRDVDALRTSVLLPQSVYTEPFRSVATAFQGASAYGSVSAGDNLGFDYEAFGGTIEMDNSQFLRSTLQDALGAAPLNSYGVEAKNAYGAQLICNTPVTGLRVGGSVMACELNSHAEFAMPTGVAVPPYAAFPVDMNLKLNSLYVLSGEYTAEALTLAAEYERMDAEYTISTPMGDDAMNDKRGGWYVQGAYRFSPLFEFGSYYSVFYPNWENRDGANSNPDYAAWQKDIALTTRFDVTDNWILKLELHLMSGIGDLDPMINPDGATTENWNMFAAKSSFYF